jgi:lipopolysaccharide export system protein LptA
MPYPDLPPEPPAIVQHLPPEKLVPSLSAKDLGKNSGEVAANTQISPSSPQKTDSAPVPGSTATNASLLDKTQPWELPQTREVVVSDWKQEPAFPQGGSLSFQSPQTAQELELLLQGHTAPTIGQIEITVPGQQPPATTTPQNFPGLVGIIEVFSDRQEFDLLRQIFTAEGNVVVRYQGGVLDANRVQGNLATRVTVAEGDVAFRRGNQLLRGERLVYNFLQDTGTLQRSRGEIFIPASGTELTFDAETALANPALVVDRPLSDRLLEDQPAQRVTGAAGLTFSVGAGRTNVNLPPVRSGRQGQVNRIRFEAEDLQFYPRGWTGRNVRITNDPFSPPELEIRTERAQLTQESPLRDVLTTVRPRIVFDQGFSLPLLQSRYVFDRTEREPPIARFGYDDVDRGGLFIEAPLSYVLGPRVRLRLTPQFFLQRAIFNGFGNPAELFGLRSVLQANLTERTAVITAVTLKNFNFWDEPEEKIRASLRAQQIIGTTYPHRLSIEYSFRDRLFNGSLGFQDVHQSWGAVLLSPVFTLGNTGINLTYQLGAQYINANTDRLDLLPPVFENVRTQLGRFQAAATVSRGIFLWRGKPLPATPTEGLRYTPYPVIPFVQIVPILAGNTSIYTSGDTQSSLSASIGLQGQFGHFSRPFFDYTAFNIRYTKVFLEGLSPFFFDRIVDNRVLSFGLTQQVYGPFRIGFQSSINLDTGESISTDYFLEYSRRTYGVTIRYNPDLQLGALVFRVSDFNWNVGSEPFQGSGVRFVDTGVIRETD